ncbi:uncharacterized protein BO72DRAFT_495247 [Aspergillus fijiensis CBS 313.89]|uniref:Uncharacterized protein n=1 Tax=Aspergillus fijiensis CBS 313.89 TaxID=1448319 RepID=A0A8G1VZP4_9EURO|nr:uncharacterized protein BO72DRAFT_495247 [Aspergillus fijiensis CBS 313.89]RAK78512.1 hypothetical protein BO72DRAFT_495247 [Aspergillus fijiensis CBS 313.89]
MYGRRLFLCLFLLPFSFCSPVENAAREDVLAKATKNYQGINWDLAANDCGGSRFNTLVEATRMAIQLTERPSQPVSTPGWNRFFLSDKHIKKREGWIVGAPSKPSVHAPPAQAAP